MQKIDDDSYNILSTQYLAIIGHYKILLINCNNAKFTLKNNQLIWHNNTKALQKINKRIHVLTLLKSDLTQLQPEFHKLKYAHLLKPLQWICIKIESIFLWINNLHNLGWGISIIIFSLLYKLFILPINILTNLSQRKVSYIKNKLDPILENIKANFSGEEAHNKFMQAHRQQGVTPFYHLKPFLLIILPFPFLISIFNVLGELNFITDNSFLWIKDLAYPDAIFIFNYNLPVLGNSMNLLPIFMTAITILAAILHNNTIINKKELNKQRRNLCFMAFGFLILFYPFPAAIVLYWTCVNIWQIIQQKFLYV